MGRRVADLVSPSHHALSTKSAIKIPGTVQGGKYARALGKKAFEGVDKATVIKDLRNFYAEAEGGQFSNLLPDFERAVQETIGK